MQPIAVVNIIDCDQSGNLIREIEPSYPHDETYLYQSLMQQRDLVHLSMEQRYVHTHKTFYSVIDFLRDNLHTFQNKLLFADDCYLFIWSILGQLESIQLLQIEGQGEQTRKDFECHRLTSSFHGGQCHLSHTEQITKAI